MHSIETVFKRMRGVVQYSPEGFAHLNGLGVAMSRKWLSRLVVAGLVEVRKTGRLRRFVSR